MSHEASLIALGSPAVRIWEGGDPRSDTEVGVAQLTELLHCVYLPGAGQNEPSMGSVFSRVMAMSLEDRNGRVGIGFSGIPMPASMAFESGGGSLSQRVNRRSSPNRCSL